jgi:hypothetical protein
VFPIDIIQDQGSDLTSAQPSRFVCPRLPWTSEVPGRLVPSLIQLELVSLLIARKPKCFGSLSYSPAGSGVS